MKLYAPTLMQLSYVMNFFCHTFGFVYLMRDEASVAMLDPVPPSWAKNAITMARMSHDSAYFLNISMKFSSFFCLNVS